MSKIPQEAIERAETIADAIELADWSGVSIGNKAILKSAIIALRADAARAQGWLYDNEDTGREFSENHPIESGEVPDATNIVPANAENLKAELLSTWMLQAEIVQGRDSLREIVYTAARAQGAEAEPGDQYGEYAEYRAWLKRNDYPHTKERSLAFAYGFRTAIFKHSCPPAPQPTDETCPCCGGSGHYVDAAMRAINGDIPPTEREKVLEEALRPFANRADRFDGVPPPKYFGDIDCELHYRSETKVHLTVGELRRARAALAGEAPSQTDRAEGNP